MALLEEIYGLVKERMNRLSYGLGGHELNSIFAGDSWPRMHPWLAGGMVILLCKPEHVLAPVRRGFDCLAVWSWCMQVSSFCKTGEVPYVYYDKNKYFTFYRNVAGMYVWKDTNMKNMLSFYMVEEGMPVLYFSNRNEVLRLEKVSGDIDVGTFAVTKRKDEKGILRGHIKTLIYKNGEEEAWLNGTTNGDTTLQVNFDCKINDKRIIKRKNDMKDYFYKII